MLFEKFGPFASVMLVACALFAVFSYLIIKTIGKTQNWTWLIGEKSDVLPRVGAQAGAVAIMALVFITISKENYMWFAGAAAITAAFFIFLLIRFNYLKTIHSVPIPLVGPDGNQLQDKKGELEFKYVLIGTEEDMKDDVKEVYASARKDFVGLSAAEFMAGFGGEPNKPDAIWPLKTLAAINSKLTLLLILIFLLAVLTVYIGASAVDMYQQ